MAVPITTRGSPTHCLSIPPISRSAYGESLTDPADAPKDRAVLINTYVELTGNSDISFATNVGSFALTEEPLAGAVGRVLSDEVDMWAAEAMRLDRNLPRYRRHLQPANLGCGYTVQNELLKAARPGHALHQLREGRGFLGDRTRSTRLSSTTSRIWSPPTLIGSPTPTSADGRRRSCSRGPTELAPRKMQARSQLRLDGGRLRSLIQPADQTGLGVCRGRTPVHENRPPLSPALRSVPPSGAA